MRAKTGARDRNVLLAGIGFALILGFLAVTWATPFASDASSNGLGTFLRLLVIPFLTLVSGAILLSVGLSPLLSFLHAELEGQARLSKTAQSSIRLTMLAILLGVLGGGFVFIGWEMVSPTTCSTSHVSSMGTIGPVCPIPVDVTLLSDGLMIVGGLIIGAGVLLSVALGTGGRRATSVRSRLEPD